MSPHASCRLIIIPQLSPPAGIKLVGLDGTLYDQTLDFLFYLGLVPERFQHLSGYDKYFAMARGGFIEYGTAGRCRQ